MGIGTPRSQSRIERPMTEFPSGKSATQKRADRDKVPADCAHHRLARLAASLVACLFTHGSQQATRLRMKLNRLRRAALEVCRVSRHNQLPNREETMQKSTFAKVHRTNRDSIALSVSDDGAPLLMNVKKNISQGIGLSLVARFADQLAGTLRVDAEPKRFTVEFPAHDASISRPQLKTSAPAMPPASKDHAGATHAGTIVARPRYGRGWTRPQRNKANQSRRTLGPYTAERERQDWATPSGPGIASGPSERD